jgi:rubredoxin-NAD+ reductase
MARWECIVCGWVYDEAKGDPENGVPAGTPWAQVPSDWLCPDCGVGKEDFSPLPEPEVEAVPHHEEESNGVDLARAPLVVIGSGLAGYAVVKEFRKHDTDTPLIVITADDGRSYSKPMLSTGFTKGYSAGDLAQVDAGTLGKQFSASVWTMTRVKAIDSARQLIKLGDAESAIHYSKLVLALGADTITPPIGGDAQDHVYAINDLLDYTDFRRALERNKAKKVVLIGAGLIGCEFANDLINGGFEVEAVDPLGYCLPGLLPESAGIAVQRALEARGARFHFGSLVTAVNHNPDGDGVLIALNNGESLHADMVVSAVGVRPRTALAKAAGIACNRGIVTNRLLETSAPGVYALGDCAEVEGHVLVYVAPLMAAARALGQTLGGKPTPVVYPAMPVTIKTPFCPVVVSPPAASAQGSWQVQQDGNDVVAEFRAPDGALLGFALTGEGIKQKQRLQKELPSILA